MNDSGSTTKPPPPRGVFRALGLRTWRGRFAWVLGLILATIVTCWILARITPKWYQPSDPTNDSVITAASRAENKIKFDLRNTVQRVPNGEQRWSITEEELNAYLAIVFAREFAESATAKAPVSRPFVHFMDGEMLVCARSPRLPGSNADGGVGTLFFSVGIIEVNGKRMGQVKLTGVRVGLLPVPPSWIGERLRNLIPAIIAAAEEAMKRSLGIREANDWHESVQDVISDVGEGKPFELERKIDRRNLIIKELRMDDGEFSFVIAPLGPPATGVLPPPAPPASHAAPPTPPTPAATRSRMP